MLSSFTDLINIKILNGGAWGRGGVGAERVRVSLPRELEEFVPEVRHVPSHEYEFLFHSKR